MQLPKGVFQAQKKDNSIYFRASITYKSKHISLGSYPTDKLAHNAFLEAERLLHNEVSLEEYSNTSPLVFERWVSLINFRDNGIYIKTPIYIYKKFFHYYFSPNVRYTFDVDDLFYYSTHTIMQRGNYLFVYDYGMQTNILSRYGIRNYSVADRDYIFVNGDSTDYRYKNILVINRYYGVFEFIKNGITRYKAKIHINGNYVIGTYKTENEAAIAYNKAIDILKTKGIHKNYTANYIENISAIEYAKIYAAARISKRIREFPRLTSSKNNGNT